MINPQVVFDKLAQFETADEIADYFRYEGITGYKGVASQCPIANYMYQRTGQKLRVTPFTISTLESSAGFLMTAAMTKFVGCFDVNIYPDLVKEFDE